MVYESERVCVGLGDCEKKVRIARFKLYNIYNLA